MSTTSGVKYYLSINLFISVHYPHMGVSGTKAFTKDRELKNGLGWKGP